MLATYWISTLLVALAEMGDRTQLLAIMLASRYRRPVPILLGILVATIANHSLAAAIGFYVASLLQATWFKFAIALSFIAMALWALIPDKPDEDKPDRLRMGVFLTTAIAFFLVEIGDKTQIATAALAARFHDVIVVAAGTTTGMMVANIPAVLLGQAVTKILPIKTLRYAAAAGTLGVTRTSSLPVGQLGIEDQKVLKSTQDCRTGRGLFESLVPASSPRVGQHVTLALTSGGATACRQKVQRPVRIVAVPECNDEPSRFRGISLHRRAVFPPRPPSLVVQDCERTHAFCQWTDDWI